MSEEFLGRLVRDSRSGVTGRVIGIVVWLDRPATLVVQPQVRPDQTVPPSVYVEQAGVVLVPQLDEPRIQ